MTTSIDDSKIQQFVLLAKGARGKGLVDLIHKATSDPCIFTFGELIDCPSIGAVGRGTQICFGLSRPLPCLSAAGARGIRAAPSPAAPLRVRIASKV